jgi:co-chaperonin GroES (HSP10)
LIGKWGGTELKIDGEEMLVLGEDEILAVVE